MRLQREREDLIILSLFLLCSLFSLSFYLIISLTAPPFLCPFARVSLTLSLPLFSNVRWMIERKEREKGRGKVPESTPASSQHLIDSWLGACSLD